ncbi:tail completion protein gp17 [Aquibaculum sediminis]|uniref:tail completion protein gp17 n=1 Tax=Aquibaculum sediminis TaxID=3231907 RepID=UPI00345322D8
MMMADLIAHLRAEPAVADLVGHRVTPVTRYEETLPAVVVTQVSGLTVLTMAGLDSMKRSRVQVDCWGTTWTSAKQVAEAVESTINGECGVTWGDTLFGEVHLQTIRDTRETGSNRPDYLFRTMLDFHVWHRGA